MQIEASLSGRRKNVRWQDSAIGKDYGNVGLASRKPVPQTTISNLFWLEYRQTLSHGPALYRRWLKLHTAPGGSVWLTNDADDLGNTTECFEGRDCDIWGTEEDRSHARTLLPTNELRQAWRSKIE
jgi:hypothetical protein